MRKKKLVIFPPIKIKRSSKKGWERIDKLTSKFFLKIGGKKEWKRNRILKLCPRLFPKSWQNQLKPIRIQGDKLILKVDNSYLRNELFYRREEIIKELNSAVKEEIIREVILI
jgi:hypothetical protein